MSSGRNQVASRLHRSQLQLCKTKRRTGYTRRNVEFTVRANTLRYQFDLTHICDLLGDPIVGLLELPSAFLVPGVLRFDRTREISRQR